MKLPKTTFSAEPTIEIGELIKKISERMKEVSFMNTVEDYKFDLQTIAGTVIIAEFNDFSGDEESLEFFHSKQCLKLDIDVKSGECKYYNKFALDHNIAPKKVVFINKQDLKILLSVINDEIDIIHSK